MRPRKARGLGWLASNLIGSVVVPLIIAAMVLFMLQRWEQSGDCADGSHLPKEASCLSSAQAVELTEKYIAQHPDHPNSYSPVPAGCSTAQYLDYKPHWIVFCDGSRFSVDDRTRSVHLNLGD